MLKYFPAALCALTVIFGLCFLSYSSDKEPMIRASLFKNNQLVALEINKEFGRSIVVELRNLFLQDGYTMCPNEQSFNDILNTIKCVGGKYVFVRISEIKAGNVVPSKDFLACSIDRFIIKESEGNDIISGGNIMLLFPKKESSREPELIKIIYSEINKFEN